MIPVYKPSIGKKELEYVTDAVKSTWISSRGKYLDRFEKDFAKFCGAKYSVATCNGTVSIHLALEALGIGKGDEVIVPTFTYIASVNSITYTGAKPVFVESDKNNWNIDVNDIEKKITKKTKAIMVVHLYGHPSEMGPILKIAKKHNIYVVEDAAESHGALYKGKKVGAIGDIGSFSFFGNKTITTGEGGMIVTNSKKLADKARHLRGQGVSLKKNYWHDVVGYNYRMTNIAAAIGVAQLERINSIIKRKREIAKLYFQELKDVKELVLQREMPWAKSVFWMVSILAPKGKRDSLMKYLAKNGVDSRPFFYPAHIMPPYKQNKKYSVAEDIASRGINLPSYPELTDNEIVKIANTIKRFFKK
ncbi:DegT/DnrJ/EryC1/StrS family aminotransferase [bacterium]|nr:DegT/DnrJ/EryC1/StrS family aminotransferase [bacterium]